MATNLSLLVIRTQKLEELKKFYETLGLTFVQEKHGDGPIHYSWTSPNGVVLELYPTQSGNDIGRNRLGVTTNNLHSIFSEIALDYPDRIVKYPFTSEYGYRALVKDLDGRIVELTQKKSDSGIW